MSVGVTTSHAAPLPMAYALLQNYPNPFNPVTTIRYELPVTSRVTLNVFNLLGQVVATLVSGEEPAGVYSVRLNGRDLASGVYFYRLVAGPFTETRKLILIK